jgi:hypothetical protein
VSYKRVRWILSDSNKFVGFWPVFQISPESQLKTFWEIKIIVEGILGEKVLELKEIKTLVGLIEKN